MPVPVLQAIVLADYVYIDAQTGKKVIAGTFNALSAPEFPTSFNRSTFAYLSLTAIRGETNIELKYVDCDENEILMQTPPIGVTAESPLDTVDFSIEVPPIPMPREGVYAFEVHCEGQILGALRITVRLLREAQE